VLLTACIHPTLYVIKSRFDTSSKESTRFDNYVNRVAACLLTPRQRA